MSSHHHIVPTSSYGFSLFVVGLALLLCLELPHTDYYNLTETSEAFVLKEQVRFLVPFSRHSSNGARAMQQVSARKLADLPARDGSNHFVHHSPNDPH